jgi:hypothetical protein
MSKFKKDPSAPKSEREQLLDAILGPDLETLGKIADELAPKEVIGIGDRGSAHTWSSAAASPQSR